MTEQAPPVCLAMCGIPFSGKSTLALEIASRGNLTLVSVDAIMEELDISIDDDTGNQRGWARAMAEGFDRSRRLLSRGASVVYDSANHTRRNRDRCRRVASQANARFRCIWIDVPVEVARERLLANRADPRRIDVPDRGFWQIVDEFESPTGEPDVLRWRMDMGVDDLICAMGDTSRTRSIG